VELREITGVPPDEAKKYAKQARKAYLDDIRYLKIEKKSKSEVNDVEPTNVVETSVTIPEGILGRVTVQGYGIIDVKDKTSYEIAKAYLKLMAEKLDITAEEG